MARFVRHIHPRLHLWSRDAPDGIPTVEVLRRRVESRDMIVSRLFLQLVEDADMEAAADPLIATLSGPSAIGRISGEGMLQRRVWRLGMAYHLTGDDKYYIAAKRQAFAIADEWCDWLDPYHKAMGMKSDLRTGVTLENIGLIYDWFYHRFTESERQHLVEAADARGFTLFRDELARNRWPVKNYRSNWMAVLVGGVGVAAMAMLDELEVAYELADLAAERVPRMLEAFGCDGGWQEGVSYWGGTYYLVKYLKALRTASAGKMDFLRDLRLQKTCWFPLYFSMPPDGHADFADGAYQRGASARATFVAVAAANRNPCLQWAYEQSLPLGRQDSRVEPFHGHAGEIVDYDVSLKSKSPAHDMALSKVFRDVGWVAIRNGWGDTDMSPVIAARAGDNRHGGCQHLDVGNVIADAFQQRMLVDHGYGNGIPTWTHVREPAANGRYRWSDPLYSTPGHNVVVVGGRNQNLDGTGTIASFLNDDKIGTVTVFDCAGAYDGVRKAERSIVHLRPCVLVVVDEFELEKSEPAWLSWHLNAIPVSDDFCEKTDLMPLLPVMEKGHFEVVGERGRMDATCVSISDCDTEWTSGAHTRIGLRDRYDNPMPNTIYPYLRITNNAARRHLFLSAFAFLPQQADSCFHWRNCMDSLRLSTADEDIVVIVGANTRTEMLSSDARLVVADLKRTAAICVDGTVLRVAGKSVACSRQNPFVEFDGMVHT